MAARTTIDLEKGGVFYDRGVVAVGRPKRRQHQIPPTMTLNKTREATDRITRITEPSSIHGRKSLNTISPLALFDPPSSSSKKWRNRDLRPGVTAVQITPLILQVSKHWIATASSINRIPETVVLPKESASSAIYESRISSIPHSSQVKGIVYRAYHGGKKTATPFWTVSHRF